jgi:uncharacterized protein (TIGR03437 family)
VLGQPDLRQNGINLVQGVEFSQPRSMALDTRGGQTHLYVSDSHNARVLAWADTASYQIGDAPALVLGQPSPQSTVTQGIGAKGFSAPLGLAVNPTNGDLYVADFGNNRVLRFLSPFANPTRVEPDAVVGQSSFTTRTVAPPSATSLNQPRAVAFDSTGNLWVADSGSNRVLRFPASVLTGGVLPAADTVIGQKDFFGNAANSGGAVSAFGLDTPAGLTFDSQDSLYVSDGRNFRVLKFAAPLGPSSNNPAASAVWGQASFSAHVLATQPGASSITQAEGLAAGGGSLYVSAPTDNRVLVFPLGTTFGPAATSVLGQTDFGTVTPNTGAFPLASANSLALPTDVKLDQNGNVFVADASNNRVIQFPAGAKAATKVWGQSDFVSNGVDQIKPVSVSTPYKMAIDYSSAPFALYVADTVNNRVLCWKDSVRFRNGDPADFAIGQPNLRTGVANVDTKGSSIPSQTSLSAPEGMAVTPTGALWVADTGNNRVLRYPRPVTQSGRITPDLVLGQADFASSVSAAVSASSMNGPAGVALGPSGEVFVADSFNSRVLEFAAGAGNGASAVRVFGQPSMTTGLLPSVVSAQTLALPQGIAVDAAGNLFVADGAANRVVIFPNTQNAPAAGSAASFVIGQANFGNAGGNAGPAGLKSPFDVALDSNGNIYVSDSGNNRVTVYSSLVFLPLSGASATSVVGQRNTGGSAPNYDSPDGLATAQGLFTPLGIFVDRQDTLYVGDSGNSRVLQFLKSASVVNAATFQSSVPVGQGSLATLFGGGLATDTATITASTWPKSAANRQLVINDDLASPIYYIGATQVNFQVPSSAPIGTDRIAVRTNDTGELIAGGNILVSASAPGLFTTNQSGTGPGAILNQDNSVNSAANPAAAGSVIQIYGTGQGPVSPAVADGSPAGTPLSNTIAVPTTNASTCLNSQPSMCVAIGSSGFGDVKFSGLAPGFIGLWQINVVVPSGLPSGNVPIRVIINGVPSGNTVTFAVR